MQKDSWLKNENSVISYSSSYHSKSVRLWLFFKNVTVISLGVNGPEQCLTVKLGHPYYEPDFVDLKPGCRELVGKFNYKDCLDRLKRYAEKPKV